MTRCLVTGARGFIGRHLVNFLAAQGESEVISAGREFDLSDPARCDELFARSGPVDYVYHLADVSGNAGWSASHAGEQFFSNAAMSINVLQSTTRHQPAARFVGFTTLWAYPASTTLAREANYWDGPLEKSTQHYGIVKKFLGLGLQACKQQWGMKGTMLALGSVYGPGDRSDHVIPSLIERMRSNPKRLEVWGNGYQVRDFIHIDDQVRAIFLHKDYDGELLNISGGQSYSIRQVVDVLCSLLPYTGEVIFGASDSGALSERTMDNSLANQISGWPGKFKLQTLKEGLALTLKEQTR